MDSLLFDLSPLVRERFMSASPRLRGRDGVRTVTEQREDVKKSRETDTDSSSLISTQRYSVSPRLHLQQEAV